MGLRHAVRLVEHVSTIRSDEGNRRVGNKPHTDEASVLFIGVIATRVDKKHSTLSGAARHGLLLDEPLERLPFMCAKFAA